VCSILKPSRIRRRQNYYRRSRLPEEFYPEALKGEGVDVQAVGSEVEVEKTVMPEFQTETLCKQKEQEQPADTKAKPMKKITE
jgi:hypothetical protein